MQLSASAISDFKKIYQRYFGEEIDDDEANKKGQDLLRLMKIIYRPILNTTTSDTDDYKSHK